MSLELNRENIRDKADWLSRQKKVLKTKNVIDMAYNNYQNKYDSQLFKCILL